MPCHHLLQPSEIETLIPNPNPSRRSAFASSTVTASSTFSHHRTIRNHDATSSPDLQHHFLQTATIASPSSRYHAVSRRRTATTVMRNLHASLQGTIIILIGSQVTTQSRRRNDHHNASIMHHSAPPHLQISKSRTRIASSLSHNLHSENQEPETQRRAASDTRFSSSAQEQKGKPFPQSETPN
ncbi:hypothetical protein LR48_Vigan07g124200 [Vigna angularis]|uniref:Uncharacterized protein n=1 Tax=Phaseolus angularis TaxID=3914 RepID=A0A0L9UXP8_PHAAN|nr:hypothetical protein LR48_Vigan07g124200 [Vigna angularis]